MSGTELGALMGGAATVLTVVGGGFGYLINLLLSQSKDTVTELKKTNADLQEERNQWRARALACESRCPSPPGGRR